MYTRVLPRIAFLTMLLLFLFSFFVSSVGAVSSISPPAAVPALPTITPSGNSPAQTAAASAASIASTRLYATTSCAAYNAAWGAVSQSLSSLAQGLGVDGIVSIAISYCLATTYSSAQGSVLVQTPGITSSSGIPSVGSSLSSLTGQQAVSPTNAVNNNNDQNAPYFITCPDTPPSSPQTTNMLVYGQDSFVGGDQCLNPVGGIPTTVTLNTQIHNPPIPDVPTFQLPSASVTPLQVSNPGMLSTTDIIYTPEVDGELSNGFNTNSYIFQNVPSLAQHAIWSWSGPIANFNNLPAQSSSTSGDGIYTPDLICFIDYTFQETTTLNWVQNTNLKFTYPGVSSSGNASIRSIGVPVFPYLFFNFNITMNSTTGGTIPNLSTLSYGVFTPETYNSPYNSLSPFPIDIPSQLIVNVRLSSQQDTTLWQSIQNFFGNLLGNPATPPGLFAMNSFATNGLSITTNSSTQFLTPQYKVISVAAMPNDYVYFLFQAMWTGNQLTQGNYYLEAARAYAPGYYQTTNVVRSTTSSTFPSAIGCQIQPATSCTQASLQQQWNASWSGYWANAMVTDSNSIHLIQGGTVVANDGSQLINAILQSGGVSAEVNGALVAGSLIPVQGTPTNVTADYDGDLFVVGQIGGSLATLGTSSTYIAKFQNVNPTNAVCTNTSCFNATYQDINSGTPYTQYTLVSPNSDVPPVANLSTNQSSGFNQEYAGTSQFTQQYECGGNTTIQSTPCTSGMSTTYVCNDTSGSVPQYTQSTPCPGFTGSGTAAPTPIGVKGTFLDIAASPTGAQIYLSGPDATSIPVFDGNTLNYESSINLVYSGSGVASLATLDIRQWLESNGLYNQSIPWLSQYASSSTVTDMPDQASYHHVLGLSDIDGYLYVLDDWAGTPTTGSQSATVGQVSFNILLLRVMNSTGADLPIAGSTTSDLVIQQQCTPLQGQGLVGDSTGSPQCFASPPPASDCPTAQGASAGNMCTPQSVVSTGCLTQNGSEYGCYSVANGSSLRIFGIGGTGENNYATVVQPGPLGQSTYPPYGWILSANILATNNVGSSFTQDVTFCSTNACTYYPNSLSVHTPGQPNNYYGNYYPLGPSVICTNSVDCGSDSYIPQGVGFSVSYNDTASFLFPNDLTHNIGYGELLIANFPTENYTKPFTSYPGYSCYIAGAQPSGTISACNGYSPLIANAIAPIYYLSDPFKYYENLGSTETPAFQNLFSSSFSSGAGAPTNKSGASKQCLAQIANGSLPTNCQNSGSNVTIPTSLNLSSIRSINVTNAIVPKLSSTTSGLTIVPYEYEVTLNQGLTGVSMDDSLTEAACNIVATEAGAAAAAASTPFFAAEAYAIAYAAAYEACIAACEAEAATLAVQHAPASSVYLNYDYGFSNNAVSLPNSAPIEGGATYIRYTNGNKNGYYTPNLSDAGVVLDPHIFLNLTSERLFGNIYINITSSATSNSQLVLNATQQLDYIANFNTYATGTGGITSPIGSGPSLTYLTITSNPITPPNYGTGYALTNLASSILSGGLTSTSSLLNSLTGSQAVSFQNSSAGFSYNTVMANSSGISVVNLFNWYKNELYDNPLHLLINGSESTSSLSGTLGLSSTSTQPALPYGYRRLIFVLQDRFDNTIYVPIDADIANQTVIILNVTPVINPINPNMTTINVNGYAGYYAYNAYGNQFFPLANGSIYLYYDNNINFNGITTSLLNQQSIQSSLGASTPPQLSSISSLSGMSNITYAQLCAFGNSLNPFFAKVPSNCVIASPIDPAQQSSASVVTYSPSYNSSGTCAAPPQSLFQQTNFNCNIYNQGGLSNACPAGQNGQQQYCFVQSLSGNGICTSQLGLFNATSTNATGYFSTNIVACGIATSTISARYYGSPGPEPIISTQPPLTESANVLGGNLSGVAAQQASSLLSSTTNGFAVYNYVWTPNQTGEVVNVGLFELGYGDISALETLSLVGIVAVLGVLKFVYDRRTHGKQAVRRKPPRSKAR